MSAETTVLKFSDQKETVPVEATNFATLKSGTSSVVPPSKFTICGSMFINFFRAQLTFYKLRKKTIQICGFLLA